MLRQMGLIREAVNIFDGPAVRRHANGHEADGEFVYTLEGPSNEETLCEEIEAYLVGSEVQWLEYAAENASGMLFIVPKHIKEPHALGIYRMTHTARTAAASTWWARVMDGRRQVERYTNRLGMA